jgi:hypothetical protein
MAKTYAMLRVFFIAECNSCITLILKNYTAAGKNDSSATDTEGMQVGIRNNSMNKIIFQKFLVLIKLVKERKSFVWRI